MQEKKINKKCPPLLKGGGFNESCQAKLGKKTDDF